MQTFINCFKSEWLKKRHTLAAWIVICGAFFTPLIIIIARLVHHTTLATLYASKGFWLQLWRSSWESMAVFLLPVGVVLATSLLTQIEFKNNTWKQVHTTPIPLSIIFCSKLLVIIVMLMQFFILFNFAIYVSALLPYLLVSGVPYPTAPIPYTLFIKENGLYFLDCMPILALQYLLGLQFKNFLVSIGAGFLIWIAAVAAISWKYCYYIPYCYSIFNFLSGQKGGRSFVSPINFHYMAVGYTIVFTIVSYILYIKKKEKG